MVETLSHNPEQANDVTNLEKFYIPKTEELPEHLERLRNAYRTYIETIETVPPSKLSRSEMGAKIGKDFVRAMQCGLAGEGYSTIEELRNRLAEAYDNDEAKVRMVLGGFMAEFTAARMLQKVGANVYFPPSGEDDYADRIDKIDWIAEDPSTNIRLAITVKSHLLSEDAFLENNYIYRLLDLRQAKELMYKLISHQTLSGHNSDVYSSRDRAIDAAMGVINASNKYGAHPAFMLLPNPNARYIDRMKDVNPSTGEPGSGTINVFESRFKEVINEIQNTHVVDNQQN